MSTLTEIYDDALERLPLNPVGILAFRLPRALQKQVSLLSLRNNAGKLTPDEAAELQKFLALEATMRVLKTKALLAQASKPAAAAKRGRSKSEQIKPRIIKSAIK